MIREAADLKQWLRGAAAGMALMLGAEHGIGAYILEAGLLYDLERLFAGFVILSLLGVLVSAAIGLVENRLLSWRV